MDILVAASDGDEEYLRKAYDANVGDLQRYFLGDEDTNFRNLLHSAVESNNLLFLRKALDMLKSHPALVIALICQTENQNGSNPLHIAANRGNIFFVTLISNAYTTAVTDDTSNQETLMPPWLKKDRYGNTPLRHSFFADRWSIECIAIFLVSLDMFLGKGNYPPEDECSAMILDSQQTSILFTAMETGCSLLAEEIIASGRPYSVRGNKSNETPLHYASRCNGVDLLDLRDFTTFHVPASSSPSSSVASKFIAKVFSLLIQKNVKLIVEVSIKGETMLDRAVEDDATWLVKLILFEEQVENVENISKREYPHISSVEACRRLIWHETKRDGTPLHIAARKGNIHITELLIQAYKSAIKDEATNTKRWEEMLPLEDYLLGAIPLYMNRRNNGIPLMIALKNKHDDCGVMLCNETFPLTAHQLRDGLHWDALLAAVNNGCWESVKTIIAVIFTPGSVKSLIAHEGYDVLTPGVRNIFQYLVQKYQARDDLFKSDEMEILSKVLSELLQEPVKDAITFLKEAAERGDKSLVKLFLESDEDLLMKSAPAWQAACKKGYTATLSIFSDKFGDQAFISHCQESQQTPLHHIELEYGQYKQWLDGYWVLKAMKNEIDNDGATPLHKAIQRDNLELTTALLQIEGIEVSIRDKYGITAFDLLENHCKLSKTWHELFMDLLRMPVLEELKNRVDIDGLTPLHRAIEDDDLEVTKVLLETNGIDVTSKDKNGTTAFDLLEKRSKHSNSWHELYMELLKMPVLEDLKNQIDIDGATPLHRAIQRDDLEASKVLLKTNGIDVTIQDKEGTTVLILLENRCKFFNGWHEQYTEFLKRPMLEGLKNETDSDGATPLHRAIQREDLELTKALLEMKGIQVCIKNNNGTTAFDLLENRCKFFKSWGKMCREIEQDETVEKLKHLFRKISFVGMQNTLAVVAALVATITFAAGITVPGGVDSSNGTAVLSTKAAFLVFSISNTIAMCSSMMVLFLLLGPMMWNPQPSLISVNISLFLLLLSLGGVMLAFMTGVYVTMVPIVIWNAFFVIVSCSLTLFVACIVLLTTYSRHFKNLVCCSFNGLKEENSNAPSIPSHPSQSTASHAAQDPPSYTESESANIFVNAAQDPPSYEEPPPSYEESHGANIFEKAAQDPPSYEEPPPSYTESESANVIVPSWEVGESSGTVPTASGHVNIQN